MPKVVTSQGLQEFVETGKHDVLTPDKKVNSKEAPPLEVKKEAPVVDVKVEEPDDGLEQSEREFADTLIEKREHFRKIVGKKHKAMKEAQEAAADSERFAKDQYDRARLAEERAAALAKELEEAKKTQAPPQPELKKPDIKDFTDDKGQVRWTEYTEATADYAAKKAVADDRVLRAQETEAAERAQAARVFKEKADKIDGFAEKLSSASVWFPNAVLEYITESDDGPQIAVYLADNPEAAERISKLRPIKAIAEIGKIVRGFDKPEAPKVPPAVIPTQDRGGAPPPITPIAGQGSGFVNTDPAKMSFRELREFEAARRKKR